MFSDPPRIHSSDDRRATRRLPIERDVRYRIMGNGKTAFQAGFGKTLNMSSGGVLFTTEAGLPLGARIELAVSWPVQLNDETPLKLVAQGILVRSDSTQAAISIERHEFRTFGAAL